MFTHPGCFPLLVSSQNCESVVNVSNELSFIYYRTHMGISDSFTRQSLSFSFFSFSFSSSVARGEAGQEALSLEWCVHQAKGGRPFRPRERSWPLSPSLPWVWWCGLGCRFHLGFVAHTHTRGKMEKNFKIFFIVFSKYF